jgi:hypothetical protein
MHHLPASQPACLHRLLCAIGRLPVQQGDFCFQVHQFKGLSSRRHKELELFLHASSQVQIVLLYCRNRNAAIRHGSGSSRGIAGRGRSYCRREDTVAAGGEGEQRAVGSGQQTQLLCCALADQSRACEERVE